MPHETFAQIKAWKTLDLAVLRSLITREMHRRMDCILIGKPHEADSTQKKDGPAQGEPQAVKPESDL
jgi:hypothetical protein